MIINFVGDTCFQDIDFNTFTIDERLIELFEAADLNVCNLESPLTEVKVKIKNQPIYKRSKPVSNPIFEMFDVFSLANNHILDFQDNGLYDTIAFLKGHHKKYFGAGINIEEAHSSLKIEHNNIKVAFIGFTRWQNAKKNQPGTAPDNFSRLRKIVKNLKSEGFFVAVYPHWNYINSYYPGPDSRKLAKKLIDHGADLIVGAHPHVIQGYEEYKQKYIYYSFGNFIFDYDFSRLKPLNQLIKVSDTFILTVHIANDYCYHTQITPVQYDTDGIIMLDGDERDRVLNGLGIISDNLQNKTYKKLFYSESPNILSFTHDVFNMAENSYLMTIISRLHRGRLEDFKVFLSFLVLKYFKREVVR